MFEETGDTKQLPLPDPADPLTLPGFAEAKRNTEAKGYNSAWLFRVVDKNDPQASFLKGGKRNYKSECPYYNGYWLGSAAGSVDCAVCNRLFDKLLPGNMWYKTCQRKHTTCPYYLYEKEKRRSRAI